MFIVDIEKKKKKKKKKIKVNKKIERRTFIQRNNYHLEFPRTKDENICLLAAIFIA